MLTDEKIRALASKWDCFIDTQQCIEAAIREALAEDGWVKVTPETMPPDDTPVLCYEPPHEIAGVQFKGCMRVAYSGQFRYGTYTHWKLIQPPTKETKDV